MKKIIVVFMLVIIVIFGVYYTSLGKGDCAQVVVSATNRITGKTKEFGNPCIVPFWYKNIQYI